MKPVLNLALGAALGQIVVLVIVAGLCWAGDWTTSSQYSTALFGAGIVLALVGLVSGLGQSRAADDFGSQHAHTAGSETATERLARDAMENRPRHRGRMLALLVGITTIGISTLIPFLSS